MNILRSARTLLLLVASVVLSGAALAVPSLTIIEDSLEMTAEAVRLPDSAQGVVVLTDCSSCRVDRYRLAANAEFLLRDQSVSYAEVREAARSGRYRKIFMGVLRASGEIVTVRVLP